MSGHDNAATMLRIFDAIEHRDQARFLENVDPDCQMHWPPSLPYGGSATVSDLSGGMWSRIWGPLQPTEAERAMDPRVVATNDDEVVVLWRQRGISPAIGRLDQEVLALYRLRDGKLWRAQMLYFDTSRVAAFSRQSRPSIS